MVHKTHQEEISGPSDKVDDALLAKDLPRPKRDRKPSRKAKENEAESLTFEVHSDRAITTPRLTPEPSSHRILSSQQIKPIQGQNSSAEASGTKRKRHREQENKEEWQRQFEATKSKPEKLRILLDHIGEQGRQPYPEKLKIPAVADNSQGRPFARSPYPGPRGLFSHFIPEKFYAEIAKNTNQYAQEQGAGSKKNRRRPWQDLTAADIGGFIGAILLLGAQPGKRDISYYWNCDENLPDWPIAEYISLKRFQQISRFLKINPPGDLLDKQWYNKVNPLADAFRAATTPDLYEIPQNLGIDEQLIRFHGRSKHTIHMNTKAAGEGYKIYSLCAPNGYMIDFRFTSVQEKIAQIDDYPEWSSSEAVVLDLVHSLKARFPQPTPYYTIHMDNFFTTRKLYQRLYQLGVGSNGTAKAGSGIPKELAYLREATTKQNNHGDWYNYVIDSVNCVGFCDMATAWLMTTVHDPYTEEYVYFDRVKRPGATLKNAKQETNVNGEEMWLLRKLYALDDYNQNMGGSDSHAQQNSYYSTAQHYHRRNWLPLFYLLIDAAVTNSYILYKLMKSTDKTKLTHAEFQEAIARDLLQDPGAILRQRRPPPTRRYPELNPFTVNKGDNLSHSWGKRDLYRQCAVCTPHGRPGKRPRIFQEISGNEPCDRKRTRISTPRTCHFCTRCEVPICYKSQCWEQHMEQWRQRGAE